jgi:hypothetical protein
MNKSLKTTKALVKHILETDKRARNSDSYLYLKVIKHYDTVHDTDFCRMTVADFLLGGSAVDVPPFESVRRTRQKVQEECPHLSAYGDIEMLRELNEEAYREFARTGGC